MAVTHSLIFLAGMALWAETPGVGEYQLKAAVLYNFAKFVEWPPGAFANANDPIGICVVGQDPFGSMLDDTVQGKKVGDRAFAVWRLPDTQQAGKCQILFIGAKDAGRTRALLEALNGASILTVGETEDFTALGGIIGFRLEGTRVRLQVALDTAEASKLRISSKLLSLAEIVKGRRTGKP